ncbi:Uncharacterized conserved protein, DUF885 familyt [Sphingopyxis sp. YR583]|uniref:DUF885 domain-containing protein n=1 Tax=Sphingopyxis sp. YR583 TaxID=1881047 RepID=UPI0008A78018|nr:DUF885 domain-containing protein [Sphingopyxis sp. YR583]SEH13927.1 Uncharacterized conserved protein, DUF885 familyt [Sphingopyxis sp. YR583]
MSQAKASLDALVEECWEALLAREPYTAASAGRVIEAIGPGDLAEAEAIAAHARARLDALAGIDLTALSRTDRLTASYLRHLLETDLEEPERWWTSFIVAPYSSLPFSMIPRTVFAGIDLGDPAAATRYVKLARDFVVFVDNARARILAQAERGWRLPRPALANARVALEGAASMAAAAILRSDDEHVDAAVREEVASLVETELKPAFARLLAAIGEEYEAAATANAGLMHQPGGARAYRLWLRYHLGTDADPATIHQVGLDEVASLAAEMARVRRDAFGYDGDEASFHERLSEDPKAKAPSAEALEASFNRHLERMRPVFARMFRKGPSAVGVVKRLPLELEAGMTFGYYQQPQSGQGQGIYYYSGNGIPDRLQLNTAALIFHELVPGHHVQLARQRENEALPAIRREIILSTAFLEGWAEYASGLGEEGGLFDNPYDYYGFLMHQRFTAQRMVVDTGLNALGWSLEEAHAYMSANTLEKPEQVMSEILRYSTDMPAQALCYRWGCLKFRALRADAEAVLGPVFDLADFHEAILDQGCLPIPVLEQNLADWATARAAMAAG